MKTEKSKPDRPVALDTNDMAHRDDKVSRKIDLTGAWRVVFDSDKQQADRVKVNYIFRGDYFFVNYSSGELFECECDIANEEFPARFKYTINFRKVKFHSSNSVEFAPSKKTTFFRKFKNGVQIAIVDDSDAEDFDFSENSLENANIALLSKLKTEEMPPLTRVLSQLPFDDFDIDVEDSENGLTIRNLHLRGASLTDDIVTSMKEVTRLKRLIVQNANISADSLSRLRNAENLQEVMVLNVGEVTDSEIRNYNDGSRVKFLTKQDLYQEMEAARKATERAEFIQAIRFFGIGLHSFQADQSRFPKSWENYRDWQFKRVRENDDYLKLSDAEAQKQFEKTPRLVNEDTMTVVWNALWLPDADKLPTPMDELVVGYEPHVPEKGGAVMFYSGRVQDNVTPEEFKKMTIVPTVDDKTE